MKIHPLYCLPPFFKYCPQIYSPPTPTPTALSVLLFYWLNGWSFTYWYYGSIRVERCYLSTRSTLMCVLCNDKASSLLSTEVSQIMLFFAGTLIWYHTHTQTHTAHSGASRLTHPYKYIFTSPVMCSQQPSLLPWMNNSLISKIYLPQCFFFSKIIHLKSHISVD